MILDEELRDIEMLEIKLPEDIYSIGFIAFLRYDSPRRHERIIQKCMWTFLFQIFLLVLLAFNFIGDD